MAPPHRWYQHVPAATAVITCEGESHRLTWRWGKVKLDDHDLGSERAMLVLGGEPCPCLRALGLWANLFDMRPDQLGQMRQHAGRIPLGDEHVPGEQVVPCQLVDDADREPVAGVGARPGIEHVQLLVLEVLHQVAVQGVEGGLVDRPVDVAPVDVPVA